MALVKFVTGTAASFAALANKDADTLYFITDEKRIYKGAEPFSGGIHRAVTSYPATGEINTIYVNTADGSAKFWNGTAYVDIVKPNVTALSASSTNSQLPTAKAVVDYVTAAIANQDISAITDRLDALEGRVTTAETKLNTIQGTGDGSIAKALSDAKAYTDTLANGAVADNTTAIASLESSKADKATTLAGYGITDAYTKNEADSAIATAVANAEHLKRAIVNTLPAAGSADEHTIYMVAKANGAGEQSYDEYMLINGAFEKIGDSAVDLTDYATKAYADSSAGTAKSKAIAAAATDASTKATAAETAAKTYTDQEIAKINIPDVSDFITAVDITTGTVNGTIAVEGTDVAVKGLGSAAYTESTAYDAAGSAAQALTDAKAYIDSALTWQTL